MSLLGNYVNKKISDYITKEFEIDVNPSAVIIRDEKYHELENRIWYSALDADEVEYFYKTNIPTGGIHQSNRFYNKVRGKMPRVHNATGSIITNAITSLVFSEKPDITVDSGNEKVNEELTQVIDDVVEENGGIRFFTDLANKVSYSGKAAIKFIIDKDVSDNVIFQVYPKEDFKVEKKYGRVTEIIFQDYYDNYTLLSHYGLGYIKYELHKDGKPAKMEELPEVAGLKDMVFLDKSGKPIKELLGVYIENLNDRSDYDGVIDKFIMLDEITSTMLYVQRSTKPKRGIPSGLCEIDTDSGKTIVPDSWDIDSTLLQVEDPEKKIQNMNELSFVSPDLASYRDLYTQTLKDVLNCVGLSPSTVGENDGGSNSSSLALNIREKASLRKRAALILIYTKALQDMAKLILQFNTANITESSVVFEDIDFDYAIDFSEYASPSFDDMVKTLAAALQAGLISQREAIKELYGDDMSEEDQEAMINEINGQRDAAMATINDMASKLKQQRAEKDAEQNVGKKEEEKPEEEK